MNKSLKLVSALVLSGSVTFFAGCNLMGPANPTAGQENTLDGGLGKLAMTTIVEQQSSAEFNSSGATSTLSSQNNGALPSLLSKSLAKTTTAYAGSAAAITIDSSLVSSGILKVIYANVISGGVSHDTLVVTLDSNIVQVSGSKVYTNGITEYYRIVDLDNDGAVAGKVAVTKTARFTFNTHYTNAVAGHVATENATAVLDVDCGADHNFDTSDDNLILAASWIRMVGGDTLGYARYTDADNDGILINKASATPSIVDVALFERNPLFKPLFAWNAITMRVVTNGDTLQDKVIRINGKEVRVSGRTSNFVVLDTTGDSTVTAGEMAEAIWTTEYSPLSDTIAEAAASLVYKTPNGLNYPAGNLFYEMHCSRTDRIGAIRSRQVDFTTTSPVLRGQKPTSGHIVMAVTFVGGKTASLVADFANGSFNGVYTGPEGNRYAIEWDSNGSIVSSVVTN